MDQLAQELGKQIPTWESLAQVLSESFRQTHPGNLSRALSHGPHHDAHVGNSLLRAKKGPLAFVAGKHFFFFGNSCIDVHKPA